MNDDALTRNGQGELAVRTVSTSGDNYVDKNDVYTRDNDGKLAVRIVGGGGGSIDTSKVVNAGTLPTAGSSSEGKFYLYTGATDENYTHGYIYECVATPVYDATVEFNPASISGTTATCSGSDFAELVAQWGSGDIDTIIKGTLTYDGGSSLLVFVGQDDTDTTVCTFQLYTQDFEDAGFTFTGTFEDGDVITFSCTITQTGSTYAWERSNVQPVPTAEDIGATTSKSHTTTLMAANWSDSTYVATVQGVTATNTVIVAPSASSTDDYVAAGIKCTAQAKNQLTFTCDTTPTSNIGISLLIVNS